MTYNSSFTGAQVDAAVDDVQEAKAALATDTTAGRLLKVGDFGVGTVSSALSPPTDNSRYPNGFIQTDSIFTTAINLPVTAAGIHFGWNDRQAQIFGAVGAGQTNRFFGRTQGGGVWPTSPVEFYHTGNLLGTVSQSGGVPTGAVMFRSNSTSGDYVMFADGTVINTLQLINVDLTQTSIAYTLPRQLSTAAQATLSLSVAAVGAGWSASGDIFKAQQNAFAEITNSTTATLFLNPTPAAYSGAVGRFYITVIGRWY